MKAKKYTAEAIADMALSNEVGESQRIDRWWKSSIWGNMSGKEKRAWAKEQIEREVPKDVLAECSMQLIGRAVSEVVYSINHSR